MMDCLKKIKGNGFPLRYYYFILIHDKVTVAVVVMGRFFTAQVTFEF